MTIYRIPDWFFQRYSDKRYFCKILFTKSNRYCNVHDLELPFCDKPGLPALPDYDVCTIEQHETVSHINRLSNLFNSAKLPLPEILIEIRQLATGVVIEFLQVYIEDSDD